MLTSLTRVAVRLFVQSWPIQKFDIKEIEMFSFTSYAVGIAAERGTYSVIHQRQIENDNRAVCVDITNQRGRSIESTTVVVLLGMKLASHSGGF